MSTTAWHHLLCTLQSGGNAIPLGKRKFSTVESTDNADNSSSDSDSDAPLPGEDDSDDESNAELDSGSDTSQLQLPTESFDNGSMSDGSDFSQESDSDEDAPLAAEQRPAATQQPRAVLPKAGQKSQQPLTHQDPGSDNATSDDDDDSGEEEVAANESSRRTSHQVCSDHCIQCRVKACSIESHSLPFRCTKSGWLVCSPSLRVSSVDCATQPWISHAYALHL